MVDPDPIELSAEIPLGLRHQVTGERLQVGELVRIVWGHDEAKMMSIPFAAIGECAVVSVVAISVEQAAGGAVLRHTLPPQVGQVSAKRRSPRPLPHDAGLHGNAARPIRHQPGGREAGRPAAAKGGAPGAPSGSAVEAAGLLGCRQHLRDERLGPTGAGPPPVPDAPKPDTEIIVVRHDAGAREVRVVANFQGVVQIGRLPCAIAPRAKRLMCLRSSVDRPRRTSRLLPCDRSVGWPPLPGFTVKCARICAIP